MIREGNEAGVDMLYDVLGKNMLAVARGAVGDKFVAEDVVQDSFLKIVRNVNKYKKGTNPCAWALKIVRNTALNTLEAEKNKKTEDIDEFYALASGDDEEEKSTTKILVETLMNTLAPPVVKQMIYLKYFLDMTVREIAKEVGKSKFYVAKKIAEAEEFMKSRLCGQNDENGCYNGER